MEATPLYFIPGAMCDERLWLPVIEHLNSLAPQQYRCELLAIPQTGDLDTAISELSQEIVANPCYLIGFSLGGYLAASLAAKYPEQVKKLLLVSSMPSVLAESTLKKRRRTISFLAKHGYQGISIERTKGLVDEVHHENMSLLSLLQTMDHESGCATLIKQLTLTMQRENVLDKLHQSQIPVYFSVGDRDCKVDISELSQLLLGYKSMELIITPSTGHMFPLESPEVLAKQIQTWFS